MDKVLSLFKNQYGYAYLKDLKNEGIHTDKVRKLVQQGVIEKVKSGLYKLVDMPMLANQGMIDICMAMPKAVICLHSALAYYEMTTTAPERIMIALPREEKPSKVQYPPVQVFYFSDTNYRSGVEEKKTASGIFKIYNIEKTIVDCFRYRNKLGLDVAREGLRNYTKKSDNDLNKLFRNAKSGRMYTIIRPYLEALVEQ